MVDPRDIGPEDLEDANDPGATAPASHNRKRDPLLGTVLDGRYLVVRLLARGGMGRIYEAEQSALGRKVALKVMDLGYSKDLDPDFHKRFFLEASTCAQLSHPNTIRVFDYGADGDICFIAMELIEGTTLLQAIHDDAPMAAERLIRIARQICASLSEAHGKGIIHRDLKPSNVLLTRHGEQQDFAKVLDFGLVKLLREDAAELTRSGLFLGSPNYMSPEQIRSSAVDQRSDIYSLGVMLFMGLTGKAPFKRDSSINVLLAQLEEPPPPFDELPIRPDVTPALKWTVLRCMEKDPAKRFLSVDELNRALKACEAELWSPDPGTLHLELVGGRVIVPDDAPGAGAPGSLTLRRAPPASVPREPSVAPPRLPPSPEPAALRAEPSLEPPREPSAQQSRGARRKKRATSPVLVGVLSAAALALIGALFLLARDRAETAGPAPPEPTAAPTPVTKSVRIESDPVGAFVFVGAANHGPTPVSLDVEPASPVLAVLRYAGRPDVTVRIDGSEPTVRAVMPVPAAPREPRVAEPTRPREPAAVETTPATMPISQPTPAPPTNEATPTPARRGSDLRDPWDD